MGEPPLLAGSVQLTKAAVSPACALTRTGIVGVLKPGKDTLLLAGENELKPCPLLACTWKVYEVPLARAMVVLVAGKGEPVTTTSGTACASAAVMCTV